VTITVVFDASALTRYASLDRGGLTMGEIIAEVADDPAATIAVPVLAVAEAFRVVRGKPDDFARLTRLLDADLTPVARIPVGADDGEVLGYLYADLDDLARAQAAMVSLDHSLAPILTANGERYRAARLGLDLLDL
jgi:hypothetical protein